MRIAIVGAGVSGLVCAWLLHPHHDVTVLEANDYAGGHTNTVEVELEDGPVSVDTGFIVYNERNYPLFSALLARLDVASQPSEMSFSVSDATTGLEYRTTNANTLFARRSNLLRPGYVAMLGEIVAFNRAARRLLAGGGAASSSLGEVLERGGWSRRLRDEFVVPLGASIWSADPDRFDAIPFGTWARFMHNHGLLSFGNQPRWRTVCGGAARYVAPLTAPLGERLRLATAVDKLVRRGRLGVEVHLAGGGSEDYDAVVLACHSDQALRLLSDPTPAEEEVLGSIRYLANTAVLHTDESVMPSSRRAWASWNFHKATAAAASGPGGGPTGCQTRRATLTYHMNRLQSIRSRSELFVTLNREDAIDPVRVLGRFEYAHPVFDAPAVAAQDRRAELQGVHGTYFCGAYWGHGFHEDGVRSAHDVARLIAGRASCLVAGRA